MAILFTDDDPNYSLKFVYCLFLLKGWVHKITATEKKNFALNGMMIS